MRSGASPKLRLPYTYGEVGAVIVALDAKAALPEFRWGVLAFGRDQRVASQPGEFALV